MYCFIVSARQTWEEVDESQSLYLCRRDVVIGVELRGFCRGYSATWRNLRHQRGAGGAWGWWRRRTITPREGGLCAGRGQY